MQKEIKVTPFYYDNVLGKQYQVIIQVGGRFSSKSYNSQIEMAANLGSKENYNLLVIEDLETGMTQGYYAGLKDKLEKFEHDAAYDIIKSPAMMTNRINKNKALFKGYASDQQKKAVKALDQITEIVVEEGEWLTYDDFVALLHQLRGGKPEDRKLNILMNPVNEQSFVNQKFILTQPDRVIEYFQGTRRPKVFEKNIETTFEYDGKTVTDITTVLVVLSTHHDNPYLTVAQRATIENLKYTDPDKYKQLGEARFIKPQGAYFHEFDKDVHVIEPFVIPDNWTRYRSLDYGLDMTACLWYAVDTRNNVYAYKELHENELIISEAAERILQVNGKDKIKLTYAPPDLMNRRNDTGKSAFETFGANGVPLYKSSNARIQGWYAVKEAIKVITVRDEQTCAEVKTSKLKIFSNCTNLIKNLPNIQRDESDPNDCANKPHDITHILDSLRAYCVTRFNGYKGKPKEEEIEPISKTPQQRVANTNHTGKNASKLAKWG